MLRRIHLLLLLAALPLAGCKSSLRAYSIGSFSMSPAIQPGDRIFIDVSQAARTNLHDGDIVAFPREEGAIVIKRILAMPGETISGNDRKIFRNGKPVDEPYLAPPVKNEDAWMTSFPERKIPSGEIFVLGDNRDHSLDSRAPEYAPIKLTDVVGKYRWTIWQSRNDPPK